jgi:hypothetical protein
VSFSLMAKETVEEGIKRIVNEEIAQGIKEIDNGDENGAKPSTKSENIAKKSAVRCNVLLNW